MSKCPCTRYCQEHFRCEAEFAVFSFCSLSVFTAFSLCIFSYMQRFLVCATYFCICICRAFAPFGHRSFVSGIFSCSDISTLVIHKLSEKTLEELFGTPYIAPTTSWWSSRATERKLWLSIASLLNRRWKSQLFRPTSFMRTIKSVTLWRISWSCNRIEIERATAKCLLLPKHCQNMVIIFAWQHLMFLRITDVL